MLYLQVHKSSLYNKFYTFLFHQLHIRLRLHLLPLLLLLLLPKSRPILLTPLPTNLRTALFDANETATG